MHKTMLAIAAAAIIMTASAQAADLVIKLPSKPGERTFTVVPLPSRDARCDSPARYEAMRAGRDCSVDSVGNVLPTRSRLWRALHPCIYRSSVTGRFVTATYARKNPATTYRHCRG